MKNSSEKSKIKLNLGCGITLLEGFINVDKFIDYKELLKGSKSQNGLYQRAEVQPNAKFVKGDVLDLPFKDNYADYIESMDMIEHISIRDQPQMFREFFRVLKPKGEIRLLTSDFNNLAQIWLSEIKDKPLNTQNYINIAEVIYGNQVGEGEVHRCPYTPEFISYLLAQAGFTDVRLALHPRFNQDSPDMAILRGRIIQGGWRSDMLFVSARKGTK